MKRKNWIYFPSFLFASILLTSCQSHYPEDIVCQTHVHRYGVPLDAQDWSARGKHGQIVSVKKDGVTVTQSYDSGILQGECTYTFPHREVIYKKQQYDRGQLIEETIHYPSGMPKQITTYYYPCYTKTSWYENGSPQAKEEGEYNKIITGEYYNLANQVESRIEQGNGFRTFRNEQNIIEYVDTIEEGCLVQRTTYHFNGAPSSTATYNQDQIHGEKRTYLPDGSPVTRETWKNNYQEGQTIEYAHGEKVAEIPYVQGKKQGIEKRFKDNGQILVQEITWHQGKKQGPCVSYIHQTKYVDWYFKNKKVDKVTYDSLTYE